MELTNAPAHRLPGARAGGLLLLFLALSTRLCHAAGSPCDPLAYGAVGDGITDNTTAIQSAINGCAAAGGGLVRLRVVSGKGTYLTSPITLTSHVGLQLDAGVTLLGTNDHRKYHVAFRNYPYHAAEALVSAVNAVDTGIVGQGTIDGQGGVTASDGGPSWWNLQQPTGVTVDGIPYYAAPYADIPVTNGAPRPWLVEFYHCSNVSVNGITLTNSPMWSLVFRYSTGITASEDTITVTPNPSIAHTDGIDLVGSSHATLIKLNVRNGGASVALKSGLPLNPLLPHDPNEVGPLPTHDVVVVNSTFSGGEGITIGGEAANGVYNVLARNIIESGTRHGLTIKSGPIRAGGGVGDYNIILDNISLVGTRQPLAISAEYPASDPPSGPPQRVTTPTSEIHDITISAVTATGATRESLIAGTSHSCIRDVTLNNVNIATSATGVRLRNMTGKFKNVTSTPGSGPAFVVEENVSVITAGRTPGMAASVAAATLPEQPCSGQRKQAEKMQSGPVE
jgi:polygalacturonase